MNNNKKIRLIGFAGRKRCGKGTLANYLRDEENAVIITIADSIKYVCCELLNMSYDELIEKKDNGYTFDIIPDNRWFKILNKHTGISVDNIKNEIQDIHFTNVRQILQVLGTDVIRKYNINWHIDKMVERILSFSDDKLIVVDDVRFPNEREAILRLSGEVFFIIRPNSLSISNHSSETALKWQDFDYDKVIINDFDKAEDFVINFKVHYVNNFETFIPESLFITEKSFKVIPDGNFGYGDISSYENFLKDIVSQVKNDKIFWDYGVIRYKTCNKDFAQKYITLVDTSIKHLEPYCNKFITFNPVITENLKLYIE